MSNEDIEMYHGSDMRRYRKMRAGEKLLATNKNAIYHLVAARTVRGKLVGMFETERDHRGRLIVRCIKSIPYGDTALIVRADGTWYTESC